MTRSHKRTNILAISLAIAFAAPTAMAENVKIAFIDTLTGPFASLGNFEVKAYQYSADLAKRQKWSGDNTFEFVPFDGKGSPQESVSQLKVAIDQGIRYIVQGNGSGVALALIDAINKYNDRNPGKEVVFLNQAAIDPDLTNSKCSFWHFRFDANVDMKMEAVTAILAKDKSVKKVYIIGQNYAMGQQFTKAAKLMLARKRPDVEIVGDDLHPIGTVKDFSPYVAKIKASGADTILTGNWGNDLSLLVKATKDAGLKVSFYTFYAYFAGTPTAIGADGADHVKVVTDWGPNAETIPGNKELIEGFKTRYNEDFFFLNPYTIVQMLSKAMKDAKSTDPVKVAFALEGMKTDGLNGELEMRARDHQLQQPLYVETWTKANVKTVKYGQENTGYGWKVDQKFDPFVASQPTSCEMKRPAKM